MKSVGPEATDDWQGVGPMNVAVYGGDGDQDKTWHDHGRNLVEALADERDYSNALMTKNNALAQENDELRRSLSRTRALAFGLVGALGLASYYALRQGPQHRQIDPSSQQKTPMLEVRPRDEKLPELPAIPDRQENPPASKPIQFSHPRLRLPVDTEKIVFGTTTKPMIPVSVS